MKGLTTAESQEWCKTRGIKLDAGGKPAYPADGLHGLRFLIPKSTDRVTWFCHFIESALRPRERCLLWVTGWGVWASSENWHLYYRLRQSYGDYRLLEEAPGHLFLDYEAHDLVSFLQVGLIAGWDIHLLPFNGYARAFVSHDGWVELAMTDAAERDKLKVELANVDLTELPASMSTPA